MTWESQRPPARRDEKKLIIRGFFAGGKEMKITHDSLIRGCGIL
jgi:hypothetical protein